MRNEKGITLMILVATVVIMAIIIGSISYSSLNAFKMNTYYNMCSDIELLDEKIALYYLENGRIPTTDETKQITELITDYQKGNVNYNPNNEGILYKIDLTQLENLSLKNTQYYIDLTSHTIYSSRGIKVGEEVYYTVPLAYEEINLGLYQ